MKFGSVIVWWFYLDEVVFLCYRAWIWRRSVVLLWSGSTWTRWLFRYHSGTWWRLVMLCFCIVIMHKHGEIWWCSSVIVLHRQVVVSILLLRLVVMEFGGVMFLCCYHAWTEFGDVVFLLHSCMTSEEFGGVLFHRCRMLAMTSLAGCA